MNTLTGDRLRRAYKPHGYNIKTSSKFPDGMKGLHQIKITKNNNIYIYIYIYTILLLINWYLITNNILIYTIIYYIKSKK